MGADDRINSLSVDISSLVDFIPGAWRRTTMYRSATVSVCVLGYFRKLIIQINDALVS